MTDAIEVALISDNNDQFNSVAVWDIRNGTTLMQYRGKLKRSLENLSILIISFIFRWRCSWKAHFGPDQRRLPRDSQQC